MTIPLSTLDQIIEAVAAAGVTIPAELSRPRERAFLHHSINVACSKELTHALRDEAWANKRLIALHNVISLSTDLLTQLGNRETGPISNLSRHLVGRVRSGRSPAIGETLAGIRSVRAAALAETRHLRSEEDSGIALLPDLPAPAPYMIGKLERVFQQFFKQRPVIKKIDGENPHGPFIEFVVAVTRASGNELSPDAINEYRKRSNRAKRQA